MLDPSLFLDDAITDETRAFNEAMSGALEQLGLVVQPSADHMRHIQQKVGEAFAPSGKAYVSPKARQISIPAASHEVPVRIIDSAAPTGVFLHLHGGGFVMGSADMDDAYLEWIVAETGMSVVSVEYRLAPEAPYPAPPDDCEIAARWLVENAMQEFGTDALAIGGESAGANLALVTLLRLRDKLAAPAFRAANLVFGVYDLSNTPSQLAPRPVPSNPMMSSDMVSWYGDQYVPDAGLRKHPDVSPLYADLRGLPPVLLTVGTGDPLLDDSLFLYCRLLTAGVSCEAEIAPGGEHGFTAGPIPIAKRANHRIAEFLRAAVTDPPGPVSNTPR